AAQPEVIYHLAGQASAAAVTRDRAYSQNVDATLHLLAAAACLEHPIRVMLASTGYVYGACALGEPATEASVLRPQGVYAQSKAEMERRALEPAWGDRVTV